MDGGDYISLAGVVIAGGSAIWAVVSARQASRAQEKAEHYQARAEQHAERATKAAERAAAAEAESAAAAKRSADAHERIAHIESSRDARDAEQLEADELDPWELVPIPGSPDCWLHNRTNTPKYRVEVTGRFVHGQPLRFPVIGRDRREVVSILRTSHPEGEAHVFWHRSEDWSDELLQWSGNIPPRM